NESDFSSSSSSSSIGIQSNCGGITACSCGDSLTSSINLTGSLTSCPSVGLNITSANVILDCNNYQITGTGKEGVFVDSVDNVSILNCYLDGFNESISLYNLNFSVIENNTLINASEIGIYVYNVSESSILNNTITKTETLGIYLDNYDTKINITNNSLQFNNATKTAAYSFPAGIYIRTTGVSANNISGNNLSHNLGPAIIVVGDSDTYENNFYFNNSVVYDLASNANTFSSEYAEENGVVVNISSQGSILNNVFRDTFFQNNTLDVQIMSGSQSNMTFYNTTHDKSKLVVPANSYLYFKSYVFANISNSDGDQLTSATITAINSINEVEDTTSSTSSGNDLLEVTEFFRTDNINYFLTPTTVKAQKGNFTRNSTSVNLLNITETSINLSLSQISCGSAISSDSDIGDNFSCSNFGFDIISDNVTLYGNNTILSGPGSNNIGINVSGVNNFVLMNLEISNFSIGINLENSNNSQLNNITLLNNTDSLLINNSDNTTIINSLFDNNSGNSILITEGPSTNNSLVNSTFDISNMTVNGTSLLFVKWYVDVNSTSNGGNPLEGVDVLGYRNETSILDDNLTTSSTGIVSLILPEYQKNGSGINYLTPHNISITFTFQGTDSHNETSVNLTQTNSTSVNLEVSLDCTTPQTDLVVSSTTTFCPGNYYVNGINITQNDTVLTCSSTNLLGQHPTNYGEDGINIISRDNVSIIGCNMVDYHYGIYVDLSHNVTLDNLNISRTTTTSGNTGVYCLESDLLNINGSSFDLSSDVDFGNGLVMGCNESQIQGNTFNGIFGFLLEDSHDNIVTNNSFQGNTGSILLTSATVPSSNNSFYYNNFSSISSYYFNYETTSGYINHFNTSVSGYPQGNTYDDYCDMGTDSNGDGYVDVASSANASDYPFTENVSSKIIVSGTSFYDYGPLYQTCPAENVFLGSTTTSSTTSASTSSGSAPPAAAPSAAAPAA
ncbi:right-handed parallel beta-helix repeat-containing protein, partial [Candidatus Woesearchaeota archaeon]|nr:right-handed parallel beta-helix repeat-containing protein [Candidatus Woesearchaeota archaeon]